jgi:hypothetical protein
MSGLGPLFGSQARAAELSAAAAAKARNSTRELEDINSLPSFQPISLGSLAVRLHTRNKGSKSWKPLTLQDLEEDKSNTATQGASDHPAWPNPRISPSPVAVSTPHRLRNVTTLDSGDGAHYHNYAESLPPSGPRLTHGFGDDPRSDQLDPLGYSSPNFGNPLSLQKAQSCQSSVMSHANTGAAPVGQRFVGPQDISPARQEEKFMMRGMQHGIGACSYPANEPFMPEQILPSFCQMSYNIGAPTAHQHGIAETSDCTYSQPPEYIEPNNAFLVQQDAIDEGEDDRYVAYGSGPPPSVVFPGIFSDVFVTDRRPTDRKSGAKRHPQAFLLGQSLPPTQALSSTQPGIRDTIECRQENKDAEGAKRESTVSLMDAVNRPRFQSRRAAACDSFVASRHYMSEDELPTVSVLQELPARSIQRQQMPHGQRLAHTEWGRSVKLPQLSSPFQLMDQSPSPAVNEALTYTSDISSRSVPWGTASISDGSGTSTAGAFNFPPPGLPFPKALGRHSHLVLHSSRSLAERSRIAETHAWFHADRRGEEQLRERVADIAREYASRQSGTRTSSCPSRSDNIGFQSTLLFGNVLANLQSYIGGDPYQGPANFANFAQGHCYEPSHAGRRSYFDPDPMINTENLPSRRPLTSDPSTANSDTMDERLPGNIRNDQNA